MPHRIEIHIHGRSLFDLHKTDNDSLDDTFGHCTACGNGNRQNAKPQQFLRTGKREGRFGLQLILEVDLRKLCKHCFTGTDNQPTGECCGNIFDVVAVFLGDQFVQGNTAKLDQAAVFAFRKIFISGR